MDTISDHSDIDTIIASLDDPDSSVEVGIVLPTRPDIDQFGELDQLPDDIELD